MTAGLRIRHDVVFTTSSDDNTTVPLPAAAPPRPSRSGNPDNSGPDQRPAGSYFSRSFNSNVVVVMAVLLFALVVAAFINTVARCILRRRRPQQPEDHAATDKGLDKSIIETLPVVAYGADSVSKSLKFDPAGGNECVVCLSEFVTGEKLRLLPDCHHGFHLVCIDTWLLTHTTCPVCRRCVLAATSPPGTCSDDSDDPACAAASRSVMGGSARFGSSRFGSARIASVDIEIEPSESNSNFSTAIATDPAAASSSSSGSRPKRSFASILSTEAMANIIHGVGSRRFGGARSQGQV